MALLKKLKASTLMETMVATVLIVVVFLMGSMAMNSVFATTTKGNDQDLSNRVNELEYMYHNKLIALPYFEVYQNWDISMVERDQDGVNVLWIETIPKESDKTPEMAN